MKKQQLKKIKQTLWRYPVVQAYLFGSHARKTAGPLSDIDIAVLYKPLAKDDIVGPALFAALSRQLHTDNIDIINIATASPLLAHRSVICGKQLLKHNPHDEAMLKTKILHAYEDTKHLREIKENAFV